LNDSAEKKGAVKQREERPQRSRRGKKAHYGKRGGQPLRTKYISELSKKRGLEGGGGGKREVKGDKCAEMGCCLGTRQKKGWGDRGDGSGEVHQPKFVSKTTGEGGRI